MKIKLVKCNCGCHNSINLENYPQCIISRTNNKTCCIGGYRDKRLNEQQLKLDRKSSSFAE